jgi:hypothetical protein
LNAIKELMCGSDMKERIKYGQWGETFSGDFDTTDRTLIDTPEKLRAFLPVHLKLKLSTREAPELALDSDRWNLGTLTILQIAHSVAEAYLYLWCPRLGW